MIDIDYTLLVQMVNFLAIMVVLHFFLYRPMKKLFEERERRINTALAEAESIKKQANGLLTDYDEALKHAKVEAHNMFALLSLEGSQEQKMAEEGARAKASAAMDSAVAQIGTESAKAREILRGEVNAISGGIVAKLLGRSI
ncbi:MAG: ATP synthase F0 subunit B [Nitrospirota bacterium]|nr:ATP synthase F0 subunit B [Nitrospirota bacterium]